ncbi:hypothetical protein FEZ60_31745 [Rhodococcus sp. MS16]|uniref:transposase n=1 Tax=Rhodococcus TaxID=1827 RepID=UPI001562ADF1|nr:MULTISPECIES: transposase [Rhodococcus]MCE4267507.1 transposase [Rhodococcus globerulus]NRI70079.1 hypothetical protein [Rhodococcus sp. MS16]
MSRTEVFYNRAQGRSRPPGDRSGRTISEVSRDLGVNENLLGQWVADERRRIDAAATSGDQLLTAAERTALARLRKQASEQEKDVAFGEKVRVHCGESTGIELYSLIIAECAHFAIHFDGATPQCLASGFHKHQGHSVRT